MLLGLSVQLIHIHILTIYMPNWNMFLHVFNSSSLTLFHSKCLNIIVFRKDIFQVLIANLFFIMKKYMWTNSVSISNIVVIYLVTIICLYIRYSSRYHNMLIHILTPPIHVNSTILLSNGHCSWLICFDNSLLCSMIWCFLVIKNIYCILNCNLLSFICYLHSNNKM